MDALNDIFDEIELICHEHMWNIKCDESIEKWNKKSKQITIKNKKTRAYSWHKPRCGFIINDMYCNHKSHFSGLEKHQKKDVDICDRKVFCFVHRKYFYEQYIKNCKNMEKIIIERIKNQKEFFISEKNKEYIEHLKEKNEI
jgi:hypothetical protein